VGAVVVSLLVAFIATWIYEYDSCKWSSTSASPQIMCLLTSLASAYLTWWLWGLAVFVKLVTVFL
jgi:hypothetical protein